LEYGPHDAGLGYAAAMMLGDLQLAQRWATRLEDLSGSSMQLATLARFGRWQQIVASARPDSHKPFALGMAYAHLQNLSGAEQQLADLRTLSPYSDLIGLLEAAIAERRGDINAAAASLQRALAIQKRDYTSEYIPLFPAGEALGTLHPRRTLFRRARRAGRNSLASAG
jgi:Tfp pilus assembly protein PilF